MSKETLNPLESGQQQVKKACDALGLDPAVYELLKQYKYMGDRQSMGKKKKFHIPHTFTIIFALIVVNTCTTFQFSGIFSFTKTFKSIIPFASMMI